MKRFFALSLALALAIGAVGCSDDDDDDDKNPAGPSTQSRLAVVNTGGDDESNISVIDFANGVAYNDLLPVAGNSELTQYGGSVYIIDKSGDRIVKFDPEERVATGEMSTGSGTAPNSIAFVSASKAFVSLSDADYVLIINPQTMTMTGQVDISSLADDDGDPDQGHAVYKDGRAYIALRRSNGRSLTEYSSIAVIKGNDNTLVGEIKLQANGIAGSSKQCIGGIPRGAAVSGNRLYAYVIGSVSDAADGAIELIDESAMTTEHFMGEADMGGSMTYWVFDTPTTGWGIVGLAERSGGTGWGLNRFDLTAGTFTPVSAFQNEYYTWALDCTSDGLVLLGSNNEDKPGIWVYDSLNDHKPVFEEPIDTGLLPKRLIVVR